MEKQKPAQSRLIKKPTSLSTRLKPGALLMRFKFIEFESNGGADLSAHFSLSAIHHHRFKFEKGIC